MYLCDALESVLTIVVLAFVVNVQSGITISNECFVSACTVVSGASLYRSACAGGSSQR